MRLTDRDLKILRWINGHRMATVDQVIWAFSMGKRMGYRRLSEMVRAGYLRHERLFLKKPGAYFLTNDGVAICGDELPAISKLGLGTYEHDLQLIDLSLRLVNQTGGEWTPERRIRRAKGLQGVGVLGHVPDGFLRLSDGSIVAIELERTIKGRRRLGDILKGYLRGDHGSLSEVWYYCRTNGIAERVRKSGGSLVRTFSWPDLVLLEGAEVKDTAVDVSESSVDFFRYRGGIK